MFIHKSITRILGASFILCCAPAMAQDSCDWGSFDASRINYPAGPLTQGAHNTMRGIIQSNGGVIAAPTATLTGAYLSGVDVFYTSLLNTRTGTLSAAEQVALQNWISTGGTLIVTADIFPLAAYESFTSFYGVTGYTTSSFGCSAPGFPVALHPITDGVTSYDYCTASTYTSGLDALILGDDGFGNDFMAVLEPATGFAAGGRILVTGDHNMFTQSFINGQDNIPLANNISAWACEPVIQVDIDIKPGSDPNGINPRSKGTIPVAILATDDFDPWDVDSSTLAFGPAGAATSHSMDHAEDVDGDGDIDMVVHFNTQETGIACGDTEATLTGETFDGTAIEGTDSVKTAGCK